ncbi:MAG: methyltransferase domain-containing protein [Longimicrobiales bacterium]|nr:methyltransferase domain-containing protein [Longimicrobiales bacterium]
MTFLGPALPDLRVRRRRAELMDDPELDAGRHRRALQALARINRISLTGWRLWQEVRDLHHRHGEPLRVLAVACGGGDVVVWVAARVGRAGMGVQVDGCDVSPRALDDARKRWEGAMPSQAGALQGADASEAVGPTTCGPRFFRVDALRHPLPEGYDLVTSSLFLHHLERGEAVALLRRMADACRRRLLVQDLRRTRLGYVLAWLGLHTLTRSDVARTDGLRSVEAAFTRDEVVELCHEAGLTGAVVSSGWPQRWIVRWDREPAE